MRRFLVVGVAGAVLTLIPGLGAAAGASGRPAKTIAAEICEPMVRTAVEASLGAPIPAAQQGAWSGRTFTCTYPLPGGRLVLAVDDVRTRGKARAAYRALQQAVRHPTRLNGLGDRAYQGPDGAIVAVKDQFVLRVDPGAAPPGLSKGDLAFAAVVAVMSCWTGGT